MSSTPSINLISTTLSNTELIFTTYYPLFLIVIGTILNLLTFIVLCRSPFRDVKKQPALHYMRTIAIFDIFVLYGWNLDHYFTAIHGLSLTQYSIPTCKIINFLSYFSTQTSAWLRVFICFDRYLSLSHLYRTCLGKSKSILIIIGCTIGVFFLFNVHILLFGCYMESDGEINPNAVWYGIYPLWDNIHLVIYNCIPLILMVIFNSGVIYHLNRLHRTTTIHNSRIQHRSISITLVITTSLFLMMTIPSGVAFAFFETTASTIVLIAVDEIYFTYHTLSFLLYMITFTEFRREFIAMIKCTQRDRVMPVNNTPLHRLTIIRTIGFNTSTTIKRNLNIKTDS